CRDDRACGANRSASDARGRQADLAPAPAGAPRQAADLAELDQPGRHRGRALRCAGGRPVREANRAGSGARRLHVPALHPARLYDRSRDLPLPHAQEGGWPLMDVRMFTVGQIAENTYLFRRDGSDRALIVDPGDEADKLLAAVDALGVTLDGILLTHTHFDHVGAVAPVARATGAEVWVPKIEAFVLADIMSYVPWPGFGPFESYEAEHTLEGGETLKLAGFEIDVIFTPGHSPGHVTFSIPDEQVVFSGDVLFEQSVGRTDLPGGDWPTLLDSIRGLVDELPAETVVYPGHMGVTSLGAERAHNPFLAELAR